MSNNVYRWDIQGLRAIAVLAVVVFHINPNLLPGGFLGVDIFFVISGYLIIGFIWRDLQQQSFTLLDFYARRIKRLLPAFLVMVTCASVAAYFLLLPTETVNYGTSLLSSLLYVSNFYFYAQSDYFNSALATSPLLHTWSLAVEEQFYFIFPLIMLGIFYRKSTCIILFLVTLALLSFVLSEVLLYINPSLSFYASPSRFWQFILGGIVAISPKFELSKRYFSNTQLELISLSALGVLIACLFFYRETMSFPGVNAILPSLATVLIIFACRNNSYSYRLLSCAVAAFFGKISYSLYLWHWPIITFYILGVDSTLSMYEQMTIFILSISAGYLSWLCVEQPTAKYLTSKSAIQIVGGSVIMTIFAVIIAALFMTGFSYRYNEQQLTYSSYMNYDRKDYYRQGSCFLTSKYNDVSFFKEEQCIQYDTKKHNALLIGDSHAAHWYSSLAIALPENYTLSQATSSGCKPVTLYKGAKRCTELMQWVFTELVANKRFDTVILSARWFNSDVEALNETRILLEQYAKKVIILGPIIEYSLPLPRLLATNKAEDLPSYSNYESVLERDLLFSSTLNSTTTHYISMLDLMCNQQALCQTSTKEGVPLQYDYGHLTHEGALELVNYIVLQL
ncbi:acyltransferase [Colwellia sp. D2M02]|uniref:acyltransferase family protein n=1 Tax=Colwellia sp. D2M02 TaxID=2841562 RepID=UPI001C0A4E3C|nr:acyltransferase family protein [Colwellia sp. D2M02]MBU2891927.1 acyltransferase [Colwellia sp. D2M02]